MLIVPALAVVLTIGAVVALLRERRFRARAQSVIGRVVENQVRHVRRSRRRRPMVFPIVEFETGGQTFRLSGSVGSSVAVHALGATVPVLFIPGAPQDAVLGTTQERFFMPMMFGVFAAVAWIVVAMLAFAVHR